MLKSWFSAKRDTRSVECPCCGSPAPWFGAVDTSKSCEDHRHKPFPASGRQVPYFRCPDCGFLFSNCLDGWSHDRIQAEIYNADYVLVDPDFVSVRPSSNAEFLSASLHAHRSRLRVLDYGGGDGMLTDLLVRAGFDATSFDPFHRSADAPNGPFDLITAFEVIEHVPDPKRLFGELSKLLKDDGVLLFSTLIQPADIESMGLGWWYAAPRNGHVSLHTRASLARSTATLGWTLASFDDNLHAAWRQRPCWFGSLETPPEAPTVQDVVLQTSFR
ncbi:MAG: class I SAM-dependent methyltransferase [Burkholderiales bacterium]|nr:class I SAM-dependent methyltransferase [Burkholderiales bacterium]